ncbi:MAG: chemotaxis protein CheA, partial [Kangiellaceae bacterium]|nr:chemotaxis protein CheA [Kangiellaceae bacterium]
MSFEEDDEILQDFLIEAGEILEELSEQLVELENDPENMDLLNGIFRGFHTVKGGAGFLNLQALVDICHITENIFDILRKGDRIADAELMDNILESLDLVNVMFDSVRAGEEPEGAGDEFLQHLGTFANAASDEPEPEPEPETKQEISAETAKTELSESSSDEITDDEFDALLDELHGSGKPISQENNKHSVADKVKSKSTASANDDITDDEFEALLDELHGNGKFKHDDVSTQATHNSVDNTSESGNITDEEFEALLDDLHGKGNKIEAKQPAQSAQPESKSEITNRNTESEASLKPAVTPKAKPKAKSKSKPKMKSTAVVTEASVRVDTKRLDDIMNMVGELVLSRNRLKTVAAATEDNEELSKAVATLDLVTADLQGAVMKTRMQPIKKVFGRFPRVVRDLARTLNKEIKLEMIGEETDLDKNLVEALADPLVHLVRNSVDHGIEMPDVRVNSGKTQSGTITLSATQEGDHIMLIIEDDGKGMDADILRGIAVEKGMMDKEAADRLTDKECYGLIFQAGFSTKKEVSDISGRGVGMDVVKTKISQLNGSLDIESELGKGTRILIKVPLTLAILPTLMVKINAQAFAFPLASVNEIFNLDLTRTNIVDGQLTIVVREKALPLFFLNEMLSRVPLDAEREKEGHVVLAQVGTQTVG